VQQRCGRVEGEVCNNTERLGGERHLEQVGLDHPNATIPGKAGTQPLYPHRVELDRLDSACTAGKLCAQDATTSPKLDNEIAAADLGVLN
jgi:hypothetical protein